MNDNNKKFSFRELCPAKIIRRIGVLFMTVVTLLLSCGNNALVAHAAETEASTFSITSTIKDSAGYRVYNMSILLSDDMELVAFIQNTSNGTKDVYANFNFRIIKNNKMYFLSDFKDSITGSVAYYDTDGESKGISEGIQDMIPYQSFSADYKISYSISGSFKLFNSLDEVKTYASTGEGGLVIKPDTIEGEYDSSIGYLHNVQHHVLGYGGLDEYGVYENYTNKFTWDNTYPKYDDSYLVEIKGRYWLQTSGFLGLGETKEYTSDVRDIVKDICYKDLKVMIDSQYIYDLFEDFREKYNPNKEGSSISWTGCTWRESDFYLRIYRWSDGDNCYHYGKWVNIHFKNSSYDCDVSAGDFDEDGNFIVDPDTDYGTGVDQDTKFGEGDDLNDADEDSDAVKNKNTFDLSNASFADVWEWFTSALAGLISSVGAIPEFFKQIFSFLPNTIYVLIGVGIVIAIILRFLGR